MSVVQDLLAALDRLDIWRRLKPLPDKVEDLERRLATLEQRAGRDLAATECPMCRSPGFIRVGSRPHPEFGRISGLKLDSWKCPSCGHHEERERDESAAPR